MIIANISIFWTKEEEEEEEEEGLDVATFISTTLFLFTVLAISKAPIAMNTNGKMIPRVFSSIWIKNKETNPEKIKLKTNDKIIISIFEKYLDVLNKCSKQ